MFFKTFLFLYKQMVLYQKGKPQTKSCLLSIQKGCGSRPDRHNKIQILINQ